jgi:pectate lyase
MSRPNRRALYAAAATAVVTAGLIAFASGTAQADTLLSDNFEDGDASNWSKSGGEWSIVPDGSQVFQQSKLDSELARQFNGSTSWTDYQVQARVKPLAFDGAGAFVAIASRSTSSTKMYRLALFGNRAELQAVNGSSIDVIGSRSMSVNPGTWYALRIDADGSSISGSVDGAQVASGSNSQWSQGRIGLVTFHATARFDDVLVTDDGSSPPTSPPPSDPPPTSPPPTDPPPPPGDLVGWATVNGSTTGGAGGSTVTVTSGSQLVSQMQAAGPRIIQVSGTVSLSGMNDVAPDKSIVGLGSNATIDGGGLDIDGVSNVIVQNLTFRDWDDDAVNVQESSHHVWIDHNTFTNGNDGAVDIKRESDFITVSWNHVVNHEKSMLLGHSDGHTADIGHLRVTYHHNWFDGSGSRHPRVRFGNPVHVFNNYYVNNAEYGVASTMDAGVLVEGNYFQDVDNPTHVGFAASDPGDLVERNNVFDNSGAPESTGGGVDPIPYSYQLDNPANIPAIVSAGAGAGGLG